MKGIITDFEKKKTLEKRLFFVKYTVFTNKNFVLY